MRTIKFRAFDDGEMLTMQNDGIIELSTFFGLIREDAILMQFTGLIDKNGREIYEGDLIRVNGRIIYEVLYSNEDDNQELIASFCLKRVDESPFPIDHFAVKNGEIIGNLYENPELIK